MKNKTDNQHISEKFNDLKKLYEKLGANLVQALELLLKENDIPYLSVYHRVKDVKSFIKKIERKKYKNPFNEIEDICGVRIICYYQSDVEKIGEIISKELDVSENINKVDKLEFDQFGYRSLHFITKIKKDWLSTPNYRGLENLKSEIQIRTVLMHAWAEIEHKLAYKSESQIPKGLRRKLSRISAKLEESDEQFEELRNHIETTKKQIIASAHEANKFDENLEFNLDNLQAFLDFAFPNRQRDIHDATTLFDEMTTLGIELKELVKGYQKVKQVLSEFEREYQIHWEGVTPGEESEIIWHQTGAARSVLELTNDKYFNMRQDNPDFYLTARFREKMNI